jgi:RHS repeat-associated protein
MAITYPNGKEVTHVFDDVGRITSLTDWLGRTTEFVYDPDSNLEETIFPAATENIDSYDYDDSGQMTGVTMSGGEGVFATIDYERDKAGLVESEVRSGLPGASEVGYGYDENNRLVEAGLDSFAYDKADNLIESPGGGFAYDKASQLETGPATTFEFDALGQRTASVPTSGPTTSYSYDQAGDLTSVERPAEGEAPAIDESFAFDGTGLMTARTVGEATSHLTWDAAGSLPLLLYDEDNNYIYGPGDVPVEQISSEEAPSFYHHDQLGSSRLLTDGSGEVDASMTYSPYGELEASSGTIGTPMLFAGQYTLAQTGMHYLRARFYDPATGQFLGVDPIGDVTRQPYSYGAGDPINKVDPTGLESEELPCVWPACAPPPPAVEAVRDFGNSVDEAADSVGGFFGSIFSSDDDSEPTLTRSEREYEARYNECPLGAVKWAEAHTPNGKRLKREGEDILGRGHSDAARERWREWYSNLGKRERKEYRKVRGPTAGKKTGR